MNFLDVRSRTPELVFPPHFLKIVVEVNVSGQPHVINLVESKQGHAPCKIFSLQQILFLCQSYCMEIICL